MLCRESRAPVLLRLSRCLPERRASEAVRKPPLGKSRRCHQPIAHRAEPFDEAAADRPRLGRDAADRETAEGVTFRRIAACSKLLVSMTARTAAICRGSISI